MNQRREGMGAGEKEKPSQMEEGPGLKVKQPYGCAKVQRVPAASVCPFSCGVFSVCWGFLLFASASWESFSFSLVRELPW